MKVYIRSVLGDHVSCELCKNVTMINYHNNSSKLVYSYLLSFGPSDIQSLLVAGGCAPRPLLLVL